MKICYVEKRFHGASRNLIDTANNIIETYKADGYDLTLRQLYYQFVSRDIIPNQQREYDRLGSVINDARLAGLVDWNSIVDRTREYERMSHWDSPGHLIHSAARQYHIDTRSTQEDYVEVWVEKDALAGVIEHACKPLDVGFLSCRGYVSQSTMWAAAQRFTGMESGYVTHIIHLGDHDPSGIDMTRDIRERMKMFGSTVEVHRIALTMDQVETYNPPPNPAKMTDSRYESYAREYGDESWELDALDPSVLNELITNNILAHTVVEAREILIDRQEEQRAKLYEVAEKLR